MMNTETFYETSRQKESPKTNFPKPLSSDFLSKSTAANTLDTNKANILEETKTPIDTVFYPRWLETDKSLDREFYEVLTKRVFEVQDVEDANKLLKEIQSGMRYTPTYLAKARLLINIYENPNHPDIRKKKTFGRLGHEKTRLKKFFLKQHQTPGGFDGNAARLAHKERNIDEAGYWASLVHRYDSERRKLKKPTLQQKIEKDAAPYIKNMEEQIDILVAELFGKEQLTSEVKLFIIKEKLRGRDKILERSKEIHLHKDKKRTTAQATSDFIQSILIGFRQNSSML